MQIWSIEVQRPAAAELTHQLRRRRPGRASRRAFSKRHLTLGLAVGADRLAGAAARGHHDPLSGPDRRLLAARHRRGRGPLPALLRPARVRDGPNVRSCGRRRAPPRRVLQARLGAASGQGPDEAHRHGHDPSQARDAAHVLRALIDWGYDDAPRRVPVFAATSPRPTSRCRGSSTTRRQRGSWRPSLVTRTCDGASWSSCSRAPACAPASSVRFATTRCSGSRAATGFGSRSASSTTTARCRCTRSWSTSSTIPALCAGRVRSGLLGGAQRRPAV